MRDNYFQTQVLSVTNRIAPQLLDAQARFMRYLEKGGRLNRAIEFLPSDEEIEARRTAGAGSTTPEHAVLLAYSKIWLNDELISSPLTDDPWIATALLRYFPPALQQKYAAYMLRHPLSREIVATHVLNSMINRVGSTFVHRLCETTGAKAHEVVRAYLLAREIFGLVPMWQAIEALDNKVDDAVQSQMLIDTSAQLERGTTWFLRSRRLADDMATTIAYFKPGVEALSAQPAEAPRRDGAGARSTRRSAQLVGVGVPRDLAARVVTFDTLQCGARHRRSRGRAATPRSTPVATIYFDIAEPPRALVAAREDRGAARRRALADARQGGHAGRRLDPDAHRHGGGRRAAAARPPTSIAAWRDKNRRALERNGQLFTELRAVPAPDAAMLSVALRELRVAGLI